MDRIEESASGPFNPPSSQCQAEQEMTVGKGIWSHMVVALGWGGVLPWPSAAAYLLSHLSQKAC